MKLIKSYEEILKILDNIPTADEKIKKKALQYQDTLLKPKNSFWRMTHR